ncbi:unnamed protein product, partial [Iphiclides podalirius]
MEGGGRGIFQIRGNGKNFPRTRAVHCRGPQSPPAAGSPPPPRAGEWGLGPLRALTNCAPKLGRRRKGRSLNRREARRCMMDEGCQGAIAITRVMQARPIVPIHWDRGRRTRETNCHSARRAPSLGMRSHCYEDPPLIARRSRKPPRESLRVHMMHSSIIHRAPCRIDRCEISA